MNQEEYLAAVAGFQSMKALEVEEKIQKGDTVKVLIARPTCPYCRLFAPKLAQVVEKTGDSLFYIWSQDPEQTEDLTQFRAKYDIPTVPGLLVAKEGQVKVVCDSSLSLEAIEAFLTLD